MQEGNSEDRVLVNCANPMCQELNEDYDIRCRVCDTPLPTQYARPTDDPRLVAAI